MEKKNKYNLSKSEYDLSKDTDEVTIATTQNPKPTPKKPWLPWVLAAVVVCGGMVFLLTRGNGSSGNEVVQANVPVVEDTTTQDNPTTPSQDSTLADADASTEKQPSGKDNASITENTQNMADKPTTQQQNQGTANKPAPKPQSTKPTLKDRPTVSNNVASTTVNGTVEEEAWSTIRGNYGNGAARKEALGSRYVEIQAKVNEFYREGKVH